MALNNLSENPGEKTRFPVFCKYEWLNAERSGNLNLTFEDVRILIQREEDIADFLRLDREWAWLDVTRLTLIRLGLEEYIYGLGFWYSKKHDAYYHRCGTKSKPRYNNGRRR